MSEDNYKHEQINEMVELMRKAAVIDEDKEFAEMELINKLFIENQGLREMLQISKQFGSQAPITTYEPIIQKETISTNEPITTNEPIAINEQITTNEPIIKNEIIVENEPITNEEIPEVGSNDQIEKPAVE